MQLKAIETRYDGISFKSRLKARWAVFFDTLGITNHYELEKFQTPDGQFCPDFWLPNEKCWIQVSPEEYPKTVSSCKFLAENTNAEVLYIVGNPYQGEYRIIYFSHRMSGIEGFDSEQPLAVNGLFAEDRKVESCLWIVEENGLASSLTKSNDPKHGDNWPLVETDWITEGFKAARRKHFD